MKYFKASVASIYMGSCPWIFRFNVSDFIQRVHTFFLSEFRSKVQPANFYIRMYFKYDMMPSIHVFQDSLYHQKCFSWFVKVFIYPPDVDIAKILRLIFMIMSNTFTRNTWINFEMCPLEGWSIFMCILDRSFLSVLINKPVFYPHISPPTF